MITTITEMVDFAQSPEGRRGLGDRAAVLAPMCEYGPSYVRRVRDELASYRACVDKGDLESAAIFLAAAEVAGGVR